MPRFNRRWSLSKQQAEDRQRKREIERALDRGLSVFTLTKDGMTFDIRAKSEKQAWYCLFNNINSRGRGDKGIVK